MDSKMEQFTLTMLGTCTEFFPEIKQTVKSTPYTKGSKVKDYPKGETLSIISSLIKTNSSPKTSKIEPKSPYPYQTDEITVVNGTKTDASNIGEKIALGLAAILKALARGQTLINIIAHSRGAVASILIAHELESIRTICTTCTNFEEILKQLLEQQTKRHKGKPTNNTPDIIEPLKSQMNLILKEEQEQWFKQLKSHLPNLTINFFGIDPVPGDFFPITWYDERYYVIPEIIKDTELIYYINERSDWGFTPIFPNVVSKEKQNIIHHSMPGHHGTGSNGNNGSQQGFIVSPNGHKTTHVQKLMIFKLLHFLSKHNVVFQDGYQIFHQYAALGRKYLGLTNEVKTVNIAELDFSIILRTLYTAIAKNQMGYEAYNATNYYYMGLTKQRRLLLKSHSYSLFNTVFITYSGYVNEEHASLMQAHFFKIFGLDTKKNDLIEMINMANSVLVENLNKIANKETSILDSEMNRKNVLEAFAIVIHQVSQQYLTDDWHANENRKESLYQAMLDILNQFKKFSASDNSIIKQFILELLNQSFTCINSTLMLQAQNLEKEFNRLQESIDNRLMKFFSELLMQLNQIENNSTFLLDEIINSQEYKLIPNHPSTLKIAYIRTKITGKGLEKYSIEQLTKSYEEQYEDTIENFANLYLQIQIFIYDIATLRSVVPNDKIQVDELNLLKLINGLITTTAERFYKERPQALPPLAEIDSFMYLAEQYAIEHLGLSDRSRKNNTDPTKDNGQTRSIFSKTYSFFLSPMSRMIYGAPVPTSTNKEIIPKESSTSLSN